MVSVIFALDIITVIALATPMTNAPTRTSLKPSIKLLHISFPFIPDIMPENIAIPTKQPPISGISHPHFITPNTVSIKPASVIKPAILSLVVSFTFSVSSLSTIFFVSLSS